MKNLLICLLISISFFSCNPAKHVSRFVKRHPELAKTDTVYTEIHDTIPAINIKAEFETSKDVSGVDSILMLLNGKIDSISKLKLTTEIKNYVINRPIIPDTIIKVIDGVIVKLYQDGKDIGVKIHKPQEVKSKTIATSTSTITPPASLTRGQQIKLWLWDNGWWVVLLLLLCWFVFGKIMKIYFPPA